MYIDHPAASSSIADQYKSVPSKYTLSQFPQDHPYFQKVCNPLQKNRSIKNKSSDIDDRRKKSCRSDKTFNGSVRSGRCGSSNNINTNTKDSTIDKRDIVSHRSIETISIPDVMSPLGTVKGDHTHFAYVATNKEKNHILHLRSRI
jgi:hypothetical protein